MNRPPQKIHISYGKKVYWFDGVVKAQHTSSLKVEDDPKDAKGTSYTNSAKKEPKELTIDFVMSDCINTLDDLTAGGPSRSVTAYQKLIEMQEKRTLLNVSTRLFFYKRMVVKSLVATEDGDSSPYGLSATITFKEVFKAVPKKKTHKKDDTTDKGNTTGQTGWDALGSLLYGIANVLLPSSNGGANKNGTTSSGGTQTPNTPPPSK